MAARRNHVRGLSRKYRASQRPLPSGIEIVRVRAEEKQPLPVNDNYQVSYTTIPMRDWGRNLASAFFGTSEKAPNRERSFATA